MALCTVHLHTCRPSVLPVKQDQFTSHNQELDASCGYKALFYHTPTHYTTVCVVCSQCALTLF